MWNNAYPLLFINEYIIMTKRKIISEPTEADERELNAVKRNKKDIVILGKSKWKIGYIRNGAKSKVTDIILNEKDERKVNAKCVAALLLNGYFSIFFLYWFLWRWFFYVKQYTDAEYLPLLETCKKKEDVESYFMSIIYLTEMRDTEMMKTREEARRILRGQTGEQHGSSEKNMDASQSP